MDRLIRVFPRRTKATPDDADALACTFEVNPPRRMARQAGRVLVAEGADPGLFG